MFQCLKGDLAHLTAMHCAVSASPCALQHSLVVLHRLARLCARIAKLRTGNTYGTVLGRTSKERICRLLAHLGTVGQQSQMLRHDMRAALLEAISFRLEAHDMRTPAALDACLSRHHVRHGRHGFCLLSADKARRADNGRKHRERRQKPSPIRHATSPFPVRSSLWRTVVAMMGVAHDASDSPSWARIPAATAETVCTIRRCRSLDANCRVIHLP